MCDNSFAYLTFSRACTTLKKRKGESIMSIEHTKTAENLRKALAGESIARNKYTYFAQAARANGD